MPFDPTQMNPIYTAGIIGNHSGIVDSRSKIDTVTAQENRFFVGSNAIFINIYIF
jgi:hypothetical protein